MDVDQMLAQLRVVLDAAVPEQRLPIYKGFKAATEASLHKLVDIAFDFYNAGLQTVVATKKIVVALLHGIRTEGNWQEKARDALQDPGRVIVVPIGLEFVDLFRFLFFGRGKPIARAEKELRDLDRLHPNSELVVVAHSFGTYVVSEILVRSPDIRIERLLLCGSIISRSYKWDRLPHEFTQSTCVNEVGTKDFWPVFARVATLGYGPSGSFGFKTARVWDRYFEFGHSDFFSKEHFDKYWKPFVWHGHVVSSPWDAKRPTPSLWMSLLGGFPFIKIVLGTAIGCLALGAIFGFSAARHFFFG